MYGLIEFSETKNSGWQESKGNVDLTRMTKTMKFITGKDLYLFSVLGLIQLASVLFPLRIRLALAKFVALMAYRLSGSKRRLSEKNLSRAFDNRLSQERIRTIVKSSFYQFWLEAFSMPAHGGPQVTLDRVNTRGLQHLQDALNKGKGAILWESSHLGRRLLAKQILHRNGFAIDQVHGENYIGGFASDRSPSSWRKQHLVRGFFENYERPFVRSIIYVTSSGSFAYTRILVDRLKQNGIICISTDSRRGQNLIPVRFLGHTDFFPTGLVNLVKLSGATVLPLFCIQENGVETSLIIEPPLHIEDNGRFGSGAKDFLAQYLSLVESYIQKYPEQYWDWHELGVPPRKATAWLK